MDQVFPVKLQTRRLRDIFCGLPMRLEVTWLRNYLTEEPDGHLLLDVSPLQDFAELFERDESVLK